MSDAPIVGAQELSAILLELYALAQQADVQRFQEQAMACVARQLLADNLLWGAGYFHDAQTHMHTACVWQLPPDAVTLLNDVGRDNFVARRCYENPDQALLFGPSDFSQTPEAVRLARYLNVQQLCSIATRDARTGLVGYLALGRRDAARAFGAREQAWLQLLMPHLDLMLNQVRIRQMEVVRDARQALHESMAVVDVAGVLHVMQAGFAALLQEEWPDWRGPRLPDALLEACESQEQVFSGRVVVAAWLEVSGLWLIGLRRKGAVDRLTPQERATAQAFAGGLSYKAVARSLGMSPATVRHHLREVYLKLEVNNKIALARSLGLERV